MTRKYPNAVDACDHAEFWPVTEEWRSDPLADEFATLDVVCLGCGMATAVVLPADEVPAAP